jgi:hypothetical protein
MAKLSPYVAFGTGDNLILLVNRRKIRPDGSFEFWVINGAWEGVFCPNSGLLEISKTKALVETNILWEGSWPPVPATDYNGAMDWIYKQLKNSPEGGRRVSS